MGPIAVNAEGAARLLSVSKDTVERLIASGKLASFKIGHSRRIRVADVERYAAEQVEAQMPEPQAEPASRRGNLREVEEFFDRRIRRQPSARR